MTPSFTHLALSLLTGIAAVRGQPTPYSTPFTVTAEQLLLIAPTSANCQTAEYPAECRTAYDAAPAISASFTRYGITHPSVAAALVSLMVYETDGFKYAVNHFPGRPGQGTRNMQMENFNKEYAASLSLQVPEGAALTDLLNSRDQWSFGSAAWFVTTQCPFSVRRALWGGSQTAWENYITTCVITTVDSSRLQYWQKATKAFGIE